MISITPIVKGEAKSLKITFLDADNEAVINTTGWIIHLTMLRHRASTESMLVTSNQADSVSGAQGQINVSLTSEQTLRLTGSNAIIDIAVDTGTGNKIPLLLANVLIQTSDQYRTYYHHSVAPPNSLLQDTPTIIQGDVSQEQDINLSFSTNLDPTFNLGVMVKFAELSTETLNYLNALSADVTAKHAEVIGA
jgi:hypothetical protein